MSITPFDFHGHEVRVVTDDSGEPRWIASDVAKILDHESATKMTRLLDDEKGAQIVDTPGGRQEMTTITESGLYSAILRSRKPEAKEFKRWVTREVLPSIRKHGAYMTGPTIEKILTDPDTHQEGTPPRHRWEGAGRRDDTNAVLRLRGGIGRRDALKWRCPRTCGFDSRRSH